MSVSVEQQGAVGRRLTITIPGASIEGEIARQLTELGKSAKVKGFRPGKAPAAVVRREYGAAVRDDVIAELMRSHYAEAVTSESLQPVAQPEFEEGDVGADGTYTFTAQLEVYPEIEPKGVAALKIVCPKIAITEADVDAVIERLRTQKAQWVAVDRAAQQKDRVNVNFEGLIAGEPFEGNRGEGVPVVLGAGEMIPGFEAGLEGIVKDESRGLELEFPADYRAGDLAGKPVHFEVTAVAVEALDMPALDAAFAAGFGCEEGGVEQLRERVRDNMVRELEERVRDNLQAQVSDQLIEANPVEVPRTLVDSEVERSQRQLLRRLGLKSEGAGAPKLPREPYEEAAERQVRLGVILNALIRREELRPDPARVEQHIARLCAQLDDPADAAREVRADNQAMRNIEALVLEDMVYDWLIEQAETSEEPMEFLAFMEPKQESNND